jgi:hypothetical protein
VTPATARARRATAYAIFDFLDRFDHSVVDGAAARFATVFGGLLEAVAFEEVPP